MFSCCLSVRPEALERSEVVWERPEEANCEEAQEAEKKLQGKKAAPTSLPGIAEEAAPTSLPGIAEEAEKLSADVGDRWYFKGPQVWGSLTTVHLAVNVETGEEVAVRTEDKNSEVGGLAREAFLLKKVAKGGGKTGFAAFHHFGLENGRHVLVTELLGPSLAKLFETHGRKFCHKTILMIGVQMLYRLENLHEMGILHRNISPENIRIGRGRDVETLFLTDFTQAKVFKNSVQHMPYRESTPRRTSSNSFSSTNTHLGAERSRRDDLESLCLVLAYFARGNLPWQSVEESECAEDGEQSWDRRLLEAKRSVAPEELTSNLSVLEEMLVYCRSLWFEADPNYQQLRKLFRKALGTYDSGEGCGMFCWSPHECASVCLKEGEGTSALDSECDGKSGGSAAESTAVPTSASGLSRSWSLRSSRSRTP